MQTPLQSLRRGWQPLLGTPEGPAGAFHAELRQLTQPPGAVRLFLEKPRPAGILWCGAVATPAARRKAGEEVADGMHNGGPKR